MLCEGGSEWRKWDFHVHTPYSILNNQFGFNPFALSDDELESAFDGYVKELFTRAVDAEIAAIGITDYFMIDGYERLMREYCLNPKKMEELFPDPAVRAKVENIYVFPNIELRLDKFVGEKAHSVNIHVIFSNQVPLLVDFPPIMQVR